MPETMSLLSWIVVGLIAGWLADRFGRGHNFGLVGNIIVGLIGAFIGGYLAGVVGLGATGLVGSIIVAFIGAVVLLFVLDLVTRRRSVLPR